MSRECRRCGTKSPDESQQCQWCGQGFEAPAEGQPPQLAAENEKKPVIAADNIKNDLTPRKKINRFDSNNKSIFYILGFSLVKGLSLKIWLGMILWAAFFFIPVLKISVWVSKLVFPIFDKLASSGVDTSIMSSTIKYLFVVQSDQISVAVYLLYLLIWLSVTLVIAISSGVCGYVKRDIEDNNFALVKTFWQYLKKYYFRMLALLNVFILAGFFAPLAIIHLIGNSGIMSDFVAVWDTLMVFLFCFVLPVFINNDYGVFRIFSGTIIFLRKNIFKALLLFILLIIFGVVFQAGAIYLYNWAIKRFADESFLLIIFANMLLFLMAVYQMIVIAYSTFSFYAVHSQKETAAAGI